MTLTSGARLGPYEIVGAIGAGGMGEVYRARDTRLDRTVAIKVLPGHLSENVEARQRFEREARTISSLSHPNICHLYDIGSQHGTDYLVMQYLEGETLAEHLRKGPLPLDQVLKIGTEVTEALEAAHRQGILHRDLKPSNIMLTTAGAKLMDFGLAKSATAFGGEIPTVPAPVTPSSPTLSIASLAAPAEPLTQKGAVLGTLQYIAPEVLQGTNYTESSARFSPDGHWVAYVSNESGGYEIYVQSFPALGQEIRVSSEGGMDPRWRSEGRELYFVSAEGQLMVAEVKTDRGLSVGIPKPTFRFSGSAQLTRRSYWPTPDGRRFLVMTKSGDAPAHINVTLNWAERLNK